MQRRCCHLGPCVSCLQREASNQRPLGSTAALSKYRAPYLSSSPSRSCNGQTARLMSKWRLRLLRTQENPRSDSCAPAAPVSKPSQESQLRYLCVNAASGGHLLTAGSRDCSASIDDARPCSLGNDLSITCQRRNKCR